MAEKYANVPGKRTRVSVGGNQGHVSWGESKYSVAFYAGSSTMVSGAGSVDVSGLMINSNSYVVITPTASGIAGNWHVTKTDPVKSSTDPANITTPGYFTVYSSQAQTADITFDYFVSNARIY